MNLRLTTLIAVGIAIAALAAMGGCSVASYYWQGFAGHAQLLASARPIDEILETTQDARLVERLKRAREIRAFASRELGLPDNASYTRYTDLGRPFVVWNVVATPALSLTPRDWCFPVAGCVNYRGFFSESEARAEARRLRALGDDVHIGGVAAYSTLGWFDDPVLSSFIRYPDTALARLVFHELAHQMVYVKDDTEFNEGFATAVEEAGVARWITAQASMPHHAALLAEQARGDRLRTEFRRLVREVRPKLAALYAGKASDEDKLVAKREILHEMRASYEAAKAGEPGLAAFDRWFAGFEGQGANNASLAGVALYDRHVPAFRALLAQEYGDFPRFYARVRELAAKPVEERRRILAGLSAPSRTASGQ
ncbi:MAG TPA: aminopeptidase [Casimicrobiaceae bacterium]|nr:aminopeptidase [Casimicrobiaceae bacterium]